eukprot:1138036-Pelagomonas_calceolata.AAC.1
MKILTGLVLWCQIASCTKEALISAAHYTTSKKHAPAGAAAAAMATHIAQAAAVTAAAALLILLPSFLHWASIACKGCSCFATERMRASGGALPHAPREFLCAMGAGPAHGWQLPA